MCFSGLSRAETKNARQRPLFLFFYISLRLYCIFVACFHCSRSVFFSFLLCCYKVDVL